MLGSVHIEVEGIDETNSDMAMIPLGLGLGFGLGSRLVLVQAVVGRKRRVSSGEGES